MKQLMLFMALAISSSTLNAQNFSFGPTGGFGHNWFHLEDRQDLEKEFHPSFNAGVRLLYSFPAHAAVSMDVKFSREGSAWSFISGGDLNEADYSLNYVRIPIQFIYNFGEYTQAVRPKISVGPSMGFLTGGDYTLKVNGVENYKEDAEKNFDDFDFGVNSVIGINYRLPSGTIINADLNYYHGIIDIYKGVNDLKNRSIGLNLAVTFPF